MMSCYLVFVSTTDNHNKYYRMVQTSPTRFKVEFGRVGATAQTKVYSMDRWDAIYDSKIAKGYQDMTECHTATVVSGSGDSKHREIEVPSIKRMVEKLLDWANKTIKQNYTVTKDEVSATAVARAQAILDDLAARGTQLSIYYFNMKLEELFNVIPRRMSKVTEFMAKSTDDYAEILDREQSLLDAISVKVGVTATAAPAAASASSDNKAKDGRKTILEENGLTVRECTPEELDQVKNKLDPETRGKFVNAWHVENAATRAKFDAYVEKHNIRKRDVHYYYHGSRNQNYWNIAVQGLKLHPTQNVTRAGAMFGYGLYFAPKAKKSVGYTSLSGSYWAHGGSNTAMLMVFKVAMGKQKNLDQYDPVVARWSEADCRRAGYDSVFAHASSNPSLGGGRLYNDEAIVYNEAACTLSYVIELTC